jgi:hypothetical protein
MSTLDGTYPHFGASQVPLKQPTTFDEELRDNQVDHDLSGSYSLDDIPEEMGDENYRQHSMEGGYIVEEDEEEDLRTSQVPGSLPSSQKGDAGSDKFPKDLPEHLEDGVLRSGGDPHPSPVSNASSLNDAYYADDPRLVKPELRAIPKDTNQHDEIGFDSR